MVLSLVRSVCLHHLLHACIVYRGIEEIARYCPEHINVKKDNGSTPLHVAVANEHCGVVSLLACHVSHAEITW